MVTANAVNHFSWETELDNASEHAPPRLEPHPDLAIAKDHSGDSLEVWILSIGKSVETIRFPPVMESTSLTVLHRKATQ